MTRLMLKRKGPLVLPVLLLLAVSGGAQTETRPFTHNGYSRPYLIHRPANVAAHPAVVFMLGGIGSTAKSESQEFNWIAVSDKNGFLVVFPELVATNTDQPANKNNITFWEMKGSRTHRWPAGALPVDDEGYLMAVLKDVLHRDHGNARRVFFAGFSSGSGAAQLLASRHPKEIRGVFAVATPLMDPPPRLTRPVPIFYIHGDRDVQFTAFEANSPRFATTPHGNWVTWGYLDDCHIQTAKKTEWGIQLSWQQCKQGVPVIADLIADFGHAWAGSESENRKESARLNLDFTDMAWEFFSGLSSKQR
ncbi:MAG TPA: PHB depolymerase family esterase [Candidatus Eisenbacteria bacterium]|nr:PHB depolymerase family esterase [Candidatus Eisenbacteria bacterium]